MTQTFPVLGRDGISECSTHGIGHLKSTPCPRCSLEYGKRSVKLTRATHNIDFLRTGDCHHCAYSRGFDDGWATYQASSDNTTVIKRPEANQCLAQQEHNADQQTRVPCVTPTSPSLVGRFCSLVKTASIGLKDVIATSEDIFVHDPTSNTHVADRSSDGYQTEVEYYEEPYKPRSPAPPLGAALSDVAAL